MACHAQLHDKIVYQLLRGFFREDACFQIALDVNIEERAHAAQGHGGAVLLLDGSKIGKIRPLYGFFRVLGGGADIITVHARHRLELFEEGNLLEKLFAQADGFDVHDPRADERLVLLFAGNQVVDSVERGPAVVSDDAPPAVRVRQSGNHARFPCKPHFIGIYAEHTVVVRGAELELLLDFIRQPVPVGLACLPCHADAAERVDAAL